MGEKIHLKREKSDDDDNSSGGGSGPLNNSDGGAGTSGGAEPDKSPVNFVIEQQASEMPNIFESDGGD